MGVTASLRTLVLQAMLCPKNLWIHQWWVNFTFSRHSILLNLQSALLPTSLERFFHKIKKVTLPLCVLCNVRVTNSYKMLDKKDTFIFLVEQAYFQLYTTILIITARCHNLTEINYEKGKKTVDWQSRRSWKPLILGLQYISTIYFYE